jgi:hypothetical protein
MFAEWGRACNPVFFCKEIFMIKQILAGLAGVAVAMIIITISETATCRFTQYVLLCLLVGYALGCLAGGAAATLAVGRKNMRPAIITGAVVMIGGVMNLMDIPHPLWFVIVSQFTYIPFAWLGYVLVKQR